MADDPCIIHLVMLAGSVDWQYRRNTSLMEMLTTSYRNKAAVVALLLVAMAGGLGLAGHAAAQEPARWYQIEISIFTNENSDLSLERWPVARMDLGFPRNARRLTTLMDALNIDDWTLVNTPLPRSTAQISGAGAELTPSRSEGPEPFQPGDFKLPDFERDAFLSLPASVHNFTDTNRALNSSANYRLLYHNACLLPNGHKPPRLSFRLAVCLESATSSRVA
jgi:hypothetical protein